MATVPLANIEALLNVSLIMTPRVEMRRVSLGQAVGEVRDLYEPDYSQLPAEAEGKAVGVLTRAAADRLPDGHVLGSSDIQQAPVLQCETPLAQVIEALVESECVLVVNAGGHLQGLVHYSDLNSQPVRVLFYMLLAALEMNLNQSIGKTFGNDNDAWLKQLNYRRQVELLGIQE